MRRAGATASKAFAGGTYSMKITYLGITVLSESGDICKFVRGLRRQVFGDLCTLAFARSNIYMEIPCPVAPGKVLGNGSIAIPADIPTGKYDVQVPRSCPCA